MQTLSYLYRYPAPSAVLQEPGGARLALATSAPGPASDFFTGRLTQPRLAADLLAAVHLIVGSRFFTPANTVARAIALADPVVTCGGGMLRFEGFSGCCSAYVRADFLPSAYDGDIISRGTTNVDFNAPMRAALARLRDADGLALSIGRDALTMQSARGEVTERKVDLPLRWLRGMLEVQAYQAAQRLRYQMSGIEALRFLRGLPRQANSRTPLWLQPGLRTTAQPEADSVRISDTSRLRVLEQLVPRAQSVTVGSDDAQQSCVWMLDFGSCRLTLLLSADTWRGFSGEGQSLHALMHGDARANSLVRAQLNWQSCIDPATLARELGLDIAQVENALRVLGACGLAGFDIAERRYFHRELPFDLDLADDLHPRLASTRDLLAKGAVTLVSREPLVATVRSGDVEHRVRRLADGTWQCTCPWFARHQGQRGPCKHVLAVEASL
jgi:hypothetical protein